MVNLITVDAATVNVTNNIFALNFSLIDNPFGLQEIQSVLTFPPRNGVSSILSIRTSDIAVVIFAIILLTFAIDHYLFKSRYLVHVGGATRDKDHPAIPDEKPHGDEKIPLDLEAGQKGNSDGDGSLKPKSEDSPDSPASSAPSRWIHRAFLTLLLLFLVAISHVNLENKKFHTETPERSSEKADAEGKADNSPQPRWWGQISRHPRLQGLLTSAVIPFIVLIMLSLVIFHILFWPTLLLLFILLQCGFYTEIHPSTTTVPWETIALNSSLHLTVWTILAVGLLLQPNRLQGTLWKCTRWTQAISWWLFWIPFELYFCGMPMAKRFGVPDVRNTTKEVFFFLRPSLVAYLYSGVVRDVLIAVRLCKFFWNEDILDMSARKKTTLDNLTAITKS